MKKLFVLMFLMIFLVGNVSAMEWDNAGRYNEETKTMTIKNGCDPFGLVCLGSDIADIQLLSELQVHFRYEGYKKVAEMKVTIYEDYNNAFKELELFNKKDRNKKFLRDYDFKVLETEEISVDDYGLVLIETLGNGTEIYESQIIGNHIEQKETWVKLTPADFKKNDVVIIGIFTNVFYGDDVEWIPNLFGVRVDEWAGWSATGGTITTDGDYTVHTFTASGWFNWTGESQVAEVLVVASGGSGGNLNAGGGGAGGYRYFSGHGISEANYYVTVGIVQGGVA